MNRFTPTLLFLLLLIPSRGEPAGLPSEGVAGVYPDRLHGRTTASGEVFDKAGLTAAHRSLSFGARVRVVNAESGQSVIVRVNDRSGDANRVIVLSQEAARQVGVAPSGGTRVVLESADEADLSVLLSASSSGGTGHEAAHIDYAPPETGASAAVMGSGSPAVSAPGAERDGAENRPLDCPRCLVDQYHLERRMRVSGGANQAIASADYDPDGATVAARPDWVRPPKRLEPEGDEPGYGDVVVADVSMPESMPLQAAPAEPLLQPLSIERSTPGSVSGKGATATQAASNPGSVLPGPRVEGYRVQFGAFRDRGNAARLAGELGSRNIHAEVLPADRHGLHRVVTYGAFGDADSARRWAGEVTAVGLVRERPTVVR